MRLTLIEKKQETPDCVSFIFQPEQPVQWTPGQFFRYQITDPNPDERGNNRFFTCAAAPFEGNIMITTRFAKEKGSSFKNFLHGMEVGQTIEADGPKGSFILESPTKECVLIAGGIGITPYRAMILDLDHQKKPINITLLYGNRDQNIVFKELFDEIASRNPNFKIHYIIDPQKIDNQILQPITSNLSPKTYYISGPEPMVEGIKQTLLGLQIPETQIKTDYFPGYQE